MAKTIERWKNESTLVVLFTFIKKTWLFYVQTFCIWSWQNYAGISWLRRLETRISRHGQARITWKTLPLCFNICRSPSKISEHMQSFWEQKKSHRKYWCKVLARVLGVIKLLSSRVFAFRGSNELIVSSQNGNFVRVLEVLAGYDTFLAKHIQKRVSKGKGHVSYFSSTLCEEFIDTLATKVLNIIISDIKQAKYYSVSVDSKPDITNIDQLTIVFRYVLPDGPVERFVKFLPIRGHTGYQLSEILSPFMEKKVSVWMISRGQSYDNASNISGEY